MFQFLYRMNKKSWFKIILIASLNIIGLYILWIFATLANEKASFIGFHRIIVQLALNGLFSAIIYFESNSND